MPKLVPMGLFATPEDMDALMANIEVFSGGERRAATVAFGVTWNFCAEATKNMVEREVAIDAMMLMVNVERYMAATENNRGILDAGWFVDICDTSHKEIEVYPELVSRTMRSQNLAKFIGDLMAQEYPKQVEVPRIVQVAKYLHQEFTRNL